MGINKIFGIALACFAAHSTSAASAELFEYKMEKISTKANAAQCEVFVKEVAERFAVQTGITPFAHGCSQDSTDSNLVGGIISYFAEERVQFLSSRDRRVVVDSEGGFSSDEACRAALPARIEQFERVYGIDNLASWCFRLYSMSSVYVARIEAVGTSDIKSVIVGFDFYGRLTAPAQSILTTIKNAAEQKFPGHVVDASFEGKLAYARATLRYYSSVRHYIDNMDEMKFATVEACEEAAQEVLNMFESLPQKPVTTFCTVDGLAGIRVNLISFTEQIGATDLFTHYQAPSSFPSREQCRESAAQVANNNDRVIGTVCTDTVPSALHMLLKN
jgi:hypothetical protein